MEDQIQSERARKSSYLHLLHQNYTHHHLVDHLRHLNDIHSGEVLLIGEITIKSVSPSNPHLESAYSLANPYCLQHQDYDLELLYPALLHRRVLAPAYRH